MVLYCAGGVRSAFAARTLAEMGYTDVVSLAGGFGAWKAAGLPIGQPIQFTPEQRRLVDLLDLVEEQVGRRVQAIAERRPGPLQPLLDDVAAGRRDPYTAAMQLLDAPELLARVLARDDRHG